MEDINLDNIPKDLDEAIVRLDIEFDDSTKKSIKAMNEMDFVCDLHFSTGTWIRNNWGLWSGSALSQYFNSLGIHHPDDMSSVVLTCYYRHLKQQNFELEKQLKYYQDYCGNGSL